MRRIVPLLALLLVTSFGSPQVAGGRAGQAPQIELKVATTGTKLKPFGTVSPVKNRRVKVKFFHEADQGFELVASKRVKVGKRGGFRAAFDRPNSGRCRIQAVYKIGPGSKDTQSFDLECFRPTFGSGDVTFQESGQTIEVEVASSSSQRSYGLMFRKRLGAEKGMVFRFPSDNEGGFWMHNTLIPLSIAFYDAAGQIVRILDMDPCEPQGSTDCQIYSPGVAYRGALEVNQGAFETWGVQEGDVLLVTEDI